MKHLIDKLALIVIILAIVVFLWIAYLLYYPVTVITPNIQPYKIITPQVKPGGQVVYEANVCKKMAVPGIASRKFVGGIVFLLPDQVSNLPLGCQKADISIPVPKEVKPGTWHLEFDMNYKINALRDQPYHLKTENFEVVP